MNNRKAMITLALTAAVCLSAGACSSNSSSTSSSTSSSPAAAAAPTAAASVPAADCTILKPISTNALTKLAPLQTMPPAQAATTVTAYIAELTADQAKLTSAQAKTDLGAFITDLQQASSPSAATAIMAGVTKLGADCP